LSQATENQQLATLNQGKSYCLYNKELVPDFSTAMLEPSYWQQRDAITGSAQGRGTTWFVAYQDEHNLNHDWVLRHYYRGGMIGKLIKDSYFFTGIDKTRAACEFKLLQHMQSLQLPAPQPVAYRIIRKHFTYRADLLSTRIKDAEDLVAILSKAPLDDKLWLEIGKTIKRFHEHNIYHHDLNAHNILIDDKEQVYLIDFDRGELLENDSTQATWKQENMQRLHRSFLKELNKLPQFHFSEKNWQALMTGYGSSKQN